MAAIATLQPSETKLVIQQENEQGVKASVSFTVSNIFGSTLDMGFKFQSKNDKANKWVSVQAPVEREFSAQGSDTVTVDIEIPAFNTEAGKDLKGTYEYELLAYSVNDPNLDFSASDPISVEVKPPIPDPDSKKCWEKWWCWVIIGVAALAIIGGILAVVLWPRGVTVPDVTGVTIDRAMEIIKEAKFEAGEVTEEITGAVEAGMVKGQNPNPGDKLEKDASRKIDMTVEAFSVKIPTDLVGMPVEQGQAILKELGFTLGNLTFKKTDGVGGSILEVSPAPGSSLAPGAKVDLVVVEKLVTIPPFTGITLDRANEIITKELGLAVGDVTQRKTGTTPLTVLSTDPVAGSQVSKGSKLNLVVEQKVIIVPSVVGMTYNDARNTLIKSGLSVGVPKYAVVSGKTVGRVYDHYPRKDAKVDPNTAVSLYIAKQPPPTWSVTKTGKGIHLTHNKGIDLDTGAITTGTGADLMVSTVINRLIVKGVNKGTLTYTHGTVKGGWGKCSKLSYRAFMYNTDAAAALKVGRYFCVRTAAGRYAELKVVSVSAKYLTFDYETWSPPKPTINVIDRITIPLEPLRLQPLQIK